MICGVYAVLGAYLIAAARNPSEHRSLISFTVWSSIVHAGIMAVQSTYDGHEVGHLVGDVPALLLVAAVLCTFLRRGSCAWSAHSRRVALSNTSIFRKQDTYQSRWFIQRLFWYEFSARVGGAATLADDPSCDISDAIP
jgi:hypothetical protein